MIKRLVINQGRSLFVLGYSKKPNYLDYLTIPKMLDKNILKWYMTELIKQQIGDKQN